MIIRTFPDPGALAKSFAAELTDRLNILAEHKSLITIALSGGSTPGLLFSILGDLPPGTVDWSKVHFFWGDERCVPAEDSESNFGTANKNFFSRSEVPEKNIHPVRGDADPDEEVKRYTAEINAVTESAGGLPRFDIVLLGMGEDGHTASIFPDSMHLLDSDELCAVAIHPVTGQKRITFTGKVINNSALVVFLVTGSRKADILKQIAGRNGNFMNFPASYVVPSNGELIWYTDKDASSKL